MLVLCAFLGVPCTAIAWLRACCIHADLFVQVQVVAAKAMLTTVGWQEITAVCGVSVDAMNNLALAQIVL